MGPNRLPRELAAAVGWGVLAYLLTWVRIELPGPMAFHTDLTEVALLGSALFLGRPWLTLVACAIEALHLVPPATLELSFETTFLMLAVAVPTAWYAHRALQRWQPGHLALGLSWCGFVVLYYFALLMPMLLLTGVVFIPPSVMPPLPPGGALLSYWRIARALPYEVLFTGGITALTFVTKEELRRRRRVEGELREALAAQRAMLTAAPVAVIGLSSEGRVSSWNPAAERPRGRRVYQAPKGEFPTTFGFAFDANDHLIVTEPFGAAQLVVPGLSQIPPPASAVTQSGALSSFAIGRHQIAPITRTVRSNAGTACWVALEPQPRDRAYVANNSTSDISIYTIDPQGRLSFTGTNGWAGRRRCAGRRPGGGGLAAF